MPELPEVNTLAVALNRQLLNDSIKSWHRMAPKLRCQIPDEDDVAMLIGKPIRAVTRIAKSIYFDFGAKLFLHVHLGMTGSFNLAAAPNQNLQHEHVRIKLTSGRILSYCDPRRFGVIDLCNLPETNVIEPFAGSLTAAALGALCNNSQRSIKTLIMDQQILAGLGNIYANEALFTAGILPFRTAETLTVDEIQKLTGAIIAAIAAAVLSGLNSLKPDYAINANTTHFPITTNVYGQLGKTCVRCHTGIIGREVIGGRSSFFCPECQN